MVNVEEQMKRIVAEQLGMSLVEVTPEKSFVADFGADSLDMIELTMEIEDEFAIEIPDEEAEKLTTVQQAIDYVNSRVTTKKIQDESKLPSDR